MGGREERTLGLELLEGLDVRGEVVLCTEGGSMSNEIN